MSTNDSHIGVGQQRPVNAVSQQQAILGNEDRNATNHLDAVLYPGGLWSRNCDRALTFKPRQLAGHFM
jgi:hypothetical protein